jgi:Ca2+-transporting ATPase
MLVTATGMQTELGKVASMLQNVEAEPTPLQQRMSQLGNVLVGSSLGLVVLVVVGGLLRTRDLSIFSSLLETSLSMAVAVVPEGLPAVITVTLAIGTQRMVRRHALIRKLPAVETLGSVTTICSDKTGTLTQNKMLVTEVCTASDQFQVSGDGYSPAGTFHQEGQPVGIPAREPELVSLLLAAGLCNDALLQQDEAGRWTISGDPTEGALLPLVAKAGLNVKVLRQQFPRQQEIPFDSARKRMSAIVAHQPTVEEAHSNVALLDWLTSQPFLVTMKGSPEAVLDSCDRIAVDNHILPLAENYRCQILVQNDRLAQQGLRVLGFAARPLDCLPADPEAEGVESQLIWLGLVGMLDAPRPEVRQAVHQCRQAGIRPIMITGDHPLTAMAIARDLGIAMAEDDAVTGSVLEGMTQDQLEQTVQTASVYARVAPEHKLRIVRALQAQGEFVAMTGDGINDAPAIKQGNIGIAMGITGTDVSKEASDMVLLDDNFATIVAAVEEGRVVYTNIRHFIRYILGSNIGEVLTIAAVPLLGIGGTPLTPLQILWMNLVTDGIPALALAMEPADPATMQQRPLNPRASIFSDGVGAYMVRIGVIFALITIAMIVTVYQVWPQAWPTMVFTTLCLAQMGHALAARSYSRLVVQLNPLTNIYLLWAVGLTTLLQIALLYVPSLSRFFGTTPLSLTQIEVCIGFSLLVFVWIELEKLFARWIVPLFQSSPVQT